MTLIFILAIGCLILAYVGLSKSNSDLEARIEKLEKEVLRLVNK